jgi:hypothetical protein
MAFRAWNRGLAATTNYTSSNAFGVWLFNGTSWYPDPTFPGSGTCPGSTILWAGKLDYWLVGSSATPKQIVCRFDGVNLVWEPLSLPSATVARLPINTSTGKPVGGVTSGACYAWNNCWFFGTDGIVVHWDGQALTDASPGLGSSPWLQADFSGAVAQTDGSGNEFGLAVADAGTTTGSHGETDTGVQPLCAAPTGSPPPQLFGSHGGPFTPLSFSPQPIDHPGAQCNNAGDRFTTDLVAVTSDSQGDVWAAGDPSNRESQSSQPSPAPLLRLAEQGMQAPCAGYDDPDTFMYAGNVPYPASGYYKWDALSVFFNDGSVLAGAQRLSSEDPEPIYNLSGSVTREPAIVQAVCGQQPTITRFVVQDPFTSVPTPIPADVGGWTTAVVANAANDGWATTTGGNVSSPTPGYSGGTQANPQPPHLYRWTDGQPVNAPAGDDNESRPSLFTLGPPAFVIGQPTVVVLPPSVTTTVTRAKSKKIRLKPAIYSVQPPKLRRTHGGRYTLYISFKVRRTLMIGLQGLRGSKVVASSGLKRFNPPRGQLAMPLDRKRWPTGLRYIFPKGSHG